MVPTVHGTDSFWCVREFRRCCTTRKFLLGIGKCIWHTDCSRRASLRKFVNQFRFPFLPREPLSSCEIRLALSLLPLSLRLRHACFWQQMRPPRLPYRSDAQTLGSQCTIPDPQSAPAGMPVVENRSNACAITGRRYLPRNTFIPLRKATFVAALRRNINPLCYSRRRTG